MIKLFLRYNFITKVGKMQYKARFNIVKAGIRMVWEVGRLDAMAVRTEKKGFYIFFSL